VATLLTDRALLLLASRELRKAGCLSISPPLFQAIRG
jgi:hypothetical protein